MSMTDQMDPLKDKLKYYILKSLKKLDANILRGISGINPLLPFYHTVFNDYLPHVAHLLKFKTVDRFILDLDYFLRYYKSISLDKLIKHKNESLKIPSNSVHITVDDGLKEIFQIIAPILKEKNLDATFFICTDFLDNKTLFYRHKASILIDYLTKHDGKNKINLVEEILKEQNYNTNDLRTSILSISYEKQNVLDIIANEIGFSFREYLNKNKPYLTSSQVKELISEGFTIGSHSRDHPYFQQLTLSSQLKQTRDSLNFLSDKFSIDYKAYSMPFNDLGIKKEFFYKLYSEIGIDIYFGSSGMKTDQFSNNFQRFHLENRFANSSLSHVIKNKYSTTIFERFMGRNSITRY